MAFYFVVCSKQVSRLGPCKKAAPKERHRRGRNGVEIRLCQAGLRVTLLQKAALKESHGRGRNGVEIRLCQAGLRVKLLEKGAPKESHGRGRNGVEIRLCQSVLLHSYYGIQYAVMRWA